MTSVPFAQTRFALLGELARLAGPTIVSRAGILVMAMVDTIMLGQYGTDALAHSGIAGALFITLLVIGVGLFVGVVSLTARRFGAGKLQECGAVWRDALPFAALVGAVQFLICMQAEAIFLALGQAPEMATGAARVAEALAFGLIGSVFFTVSTFFLEGIRRPIVGMVAMLIANVVNFGLNWMLIYGNLGAPELGAVGSGIATAAVRCALGLGLVIFVLRMPDRATFGLISLRLSAFTGSWKRNREARRIGYAAGVAIGFEVTAHAALMLFAGMMGAAAAAAYAIAHNVEAVLFMVALGVGSAGAVLVGNAWGREDLPMVRAAGRTAILAGLTVMALLSSILAIGYEHVSFIYTSDPSLRAAAAPLMLLVALAILADAGQLICGQILRGIGDVWGATLRYAIAFWGVMVPLGYVLGIVLGFGPSGLLLALFAGCAVLFLLLFNRFEALTRDGAAH